MPAITNTIWLNGEVVEGNRVFLSIASPSLHYGVGVFDGIMAYWNDGHYYVHYGEEHLQRMLNSCARLGLIVRWSVRDLYAGISDLLQMLEPDDYYIRPLVYRNHAQLPLTGSADHLAADVAILAMAVPRGVTALLTCHLSPFERVSGKAIPVSWKVCAAYTNSYLVRRAAEQENFDDGIMLSREGIICEASAANVFFIKQGSLVTPALRPEIFPGITRRIIIERAQAFGAEVIERDVRPEELGDFDGAFLTATLMEIKPVSAIGHHQYDSALNPLFTELLAEFQKITRQ